MINVRSGLVIAGPNAGEFRTEERPFFEVLEPPKFSLAVSSLSDPIASDSIRKLRYNWDSGFNYYRGDVQVFSGPVWLLEGWDKANAISHLYKAYQHFAQNKPAKQEQLVLEEIVDILKAGKYKPGDPPITSPKDQDTLNQISQLLKEWGFNL